MHRTRKAAEKKAKRNPQKNRHAVDKHGLRHHGDMFRNRSYQNASRLRSPGIDALIDPHFYRASTRPRIRNAKRATAKRASVQLELFIGREEKRSHAERPLCDLFPDAYEQSD